MKIFTLFYALFGRIETNAYLCTVETIELNTKKYKMETNITVEMENEMFLTGFGVEHLNMQPNMDFYN